MLGLELKLEVAKAPA